MNMRDRMLARSPRAQSPWYAIRAEAEADRAVVRIYDEISWWGVSADDFARDIAALSVSEIEVQINSPGGNVFDGIAIFNALRMHPARIVTRVDGLAASAASVIVQAGDHRVMVQASQMMIHDAWGAAYGTAEELRDFADLLDRQCEVIAETYAHRSGDAGGDAASFRELMAAETWLTDTGAVELGLADEVLIPASQPADSPRPLTPAPGPAPAAFDPSRLLSRAAVRETFGSTALAD